MKRPLRKSLNLNSLRFVGIPEKFFKTTLRDFDVSHDKELQQVYTFVNNYLHTMNETELKDMKGICFYGSNGVGKTMLASIILKRAYIMRYSIRRATFVEYMNRYTAVWASRAIDERELIRDDLYSNYKAVEYLVIEEIGKEVDSKASAPILEDLLRYREDKGLVTIICTNLSPKDIEAKYGASVFSLMKGNMIPVKIVGNDMR